MASSKHERQAVSEDEWTTRYGYLLSVLPLPIADRAHVAAFTELSRTQREGLLEEVAPVLPDAWRAATSEARRRLTSAAGRAPTRCHGALRYRRGDRPPLHRERAGPCVLRGRRRIGTIDQQPLWVQELIHHESSPIDVGARHHRKGLNSRHYGSNYRHGERAISCRRQDPYPGTDHTIVDYRLVRGTSMAGFSSSAALTSTGCASSVGVDRLRGRISPQSP